MITIIRLIRQTIPLDLSFPFPVDARCEDLGNGTYEFTYELQRAGEYQCSLQTAGHEHCVYVTCEPGALDPNSCTVEEPASLVDEPWRAGSPLPGEAGRSSMPRTNAAGSSKHSKKARVQRVQKLGKSPRQTENCANKL